MLLAWVERRKKRSDERRAMDGYNYAAGALLRSGGSFVVISRLNAESGGTFDYGPFDRGVQNAVRDWKATVAIKLTGDMYAD